MLLHFFLWKQIILISELLIEGCGQEAASPHFHLTGNNPFQNSVHDSGSIVAQEHVTLPGDLR